MKNAKARARWAYIHAFLFVSNAGLFAYTGEKESLIISLVTFAMIAWGVGQVIDNIVDVAEASKADDR